MFNEFKIGDKVFVEGIGEIDGTVYKNIPAKIVERDPYFKDYLVKFKNGNLMEYLRQIYMTLLI